MNWLLLPVVSALVLTLALAGPVAPTAAALAAPAYAAPAPGVSSAFHAAAPNGQAAWVPPTAPAPGRVFIPNSTNPAAGQDCSTEAGRPVCSTTPTKSKCSTKSATQTCSAYSTVAGVMDDFCSVSVPGVPRPVCTMTGSSTTSCSVIGGGAGTGPNHCSVMPGSGGACTIKPGSGGFCSASAPNTCSVFGQPPTGNVCRD